MRTSAKFKTRRPAKKKSTRKTSSGTRKWSGQVTAHSDALTLEASVFKKTPAAIARSLKRSAERSHRRQSTPFRAAMSMLTFYINRAGSNLTVTQRRKLDAAKDELRKAFGRDA